MYRMLIIVSTLVTIVQSPSVRLFATPRTAAGQASLSFTISLSLLRFMSIESVMLFTTISSSATLFFCIQSFPAQGPFPMSRLFASGAKVLELQFQHQSFQ